MLIDTGQEIPMKYLGFTITLQKKCEFSMFFFVMMFEIRFCSFHDDFLLQDDWLYITNLLLVQIIPH